MSPRAKRRQPPGELSGTRGLQGNSALPRRGNGEAPGQSCGANNHSLRPIGAGSEEAHDFHGLRFARSWRRSTRGYRRFGRIRCPLTIPAPAAYRTKMEPSRFDRRLMLYGMGSVLAGTIIALFGTPATSESPRRRLERGSQPEVMRWTIPGWTIAGVGLIVALTGLIRVLIQWPGCGNDVTRPAPTKQHKQISEEQGPPVT